MITCFCSNQAYTIGNPLPVVVFDIDGTLSNDFHRQHLAMFARSNQKFRARGDECSSQCDWDVYHNRHKRDAPNHEIVNIADSYLKSNDYEVWLLTARPSKYIVSTLEWVNCYLVDLPDKIIMRDKGEFQPAHQLKKNFLKQQLPLVERYHLLIDNDPKVIESCGNIANCFLYNQYKTDQIPEIYATPRTKTRQNATYHKIPASGIGLYGNLHRSYPIQPICIPLE